MTSAPVSACRKLFERQTQDPFQTLADINDRKDNYQHWLRWRVEVLERHYAELTAYVRSLKATATLQVNSYPGRSWQSGESRPGHSAGLSRAVSDASLELFWHVDDPANPLHSGFVCGLGRALAGGRMSEIWFPPTCHGIDNVAVPTAELRARVWTAFTHGAVPQIPIGGWKNVQELQQIFRDIKLRQPYLTRLNSLKYAALVVHPNNGAYPLDPPAREDLKAEVMGIYRMLVEEHVPFDVLTEINLEQDELAAYRVVILPEYFHLSVDAERNLRQFVRDGGGLVATGRTSLFQPDGKQGGKFQLEDLLGASLRGQFGRASLEDHARRGHLADTS